MMKPEMSTTTANDSGKNLKDSMDWVEEMRLKHIESAG